MESRAKGDKEMVGTGNFGFGGDVDGGLGGETAGGGGGYRRYGDGDGQLIKWEDTASNTTLRNEPNDPLACAPGLELRL